MCKNLCFGEGGGVGKRVSGGGFLFVSFWEGEHYIYVCLTTLLSISRQTQTGRQLDR